MHILLISHTASPSSGWGTMTHGHALALLRFGIPFTLLLPKTAPKVQTAYIENTQHVLPSLPLSFTGVNIYKLSRLFARITDLPSKATLVHSLVDFPYAILGARIAHKIGIPFIFTGHGTYSVAPFYRWPDRGLFLRAYRDAKAIIVPSQFTAQRMEEATGIKRPIEIIENPTNMPAPYGKKDSLFLQSIPPDAQIILTVGALKLRKGIDIVIRAFAKLHPSFPSIHLVIVGKGNPLPYRQLTDSLSLEGDVHFLDSVSPECLASLMDKSEFFILTPRYVKHEFEGYGLVFLEAGLYRKAVIGSASGGVPQVVHHNENGLLVPENDVEATADAMKTLLKDPKLCRRLGEQGFKYAQSLSWSSYIDRVLNIYRYAVAN